MNENLGLNNRKVSSSATPEIITPYIISADKGKMTDINVNNEENLQYTNSEPNYSNKEENNNDHLLTGYRPFRNNVNSEDNLSDTNSKTNYSYEEEYYDGHRSFGSGSRESWCMDPQPL
ncbi:9856_t:CDS:1, partial [Dentiscutata erythropus]